MTKMTPRKLRRDTENLLDLLLRADIALYVNPVVETRSGRGGKTRVTWAEKPGTGREWFRRELTTIEGYLAWLQEEAYSAVLADGALLQISYDFFGGQMSGHRLAYIPCPFDMDEELLQADPLLDVMELYAGQPVSEIRLRTPLRFDYDPESQALDHPASHLTLLWPHCRWPVAGPLSPGHFIRFVFQHFYPRLWRAHEFLRTWPRVENDRTITPLEESQLHVAWRV
jgi:hypothetical protein